MNEPPLQTALIGLGSVSQRGLLPHLTMDDARDWIDLVAVCDVVESRAAETARRYGVAHWYTDAGALIASQPLDLLLIATPAAFHFPIAMAAVEAGLHVHLQKPMATTVEQADRLIEAARLKGVRLAASPGQGLCPGVGQLRRYIQGGAIGQIYWSMATTAFRGHEFESFRDQEPVDPTWYYKPGGGPVYDMSTYVLHTLTSILGRVRAVTAMSEIGLPVRRFGGRDIQVEMDDNTLLLLDFEEHGIGVVGGHFAEMGRRLDWGFTGIYGSSGAFEITGRLADTPYPGHVEVNPPGLAAELGLEGHPNLRSDVPFLTGRHRAVDEAHLWVDIRHLVECILKDKDPVPSGEHARHVIEIIEKGYLAARTGRTQTVESGLEVD